MKIDVVQSSLESTFSALPNTVTGALPVYHGKVRDIVDLGENLLMIASDRISAFDRVLSTVPFKGEILTRIARFWFNATGDIIPNHFLSDNESAYKLETISPRTMLCKKAQMLPIEVIVRGYVTGSAWRDYMKGNTISGIRLPDGMKENQKLPKPILTPTTKESEGHDKPISCEEIVSSGLVDADLMRQVEKAALALFERGNEIVGKQGLILVDTKYEFGLINGKLHICDEMHTPDSSRYWYKDTYENLFKQGEKQRELDKEYFRRFLMDKGFSGDGNPPEIPASIRTEIALRYISAYETITGKEFSVEKRSLEAELEYIKKICAC